MIITASQWALDNDGARINRLIESARDLCTHTTEDQDGRLIIVRFYRDEQLLAKLTHAPDYKSIEIP